MRNEEVAKIFDDVADMLEIGGENFLRVRAYRNAARTVRDFPATYAELAREPEAIKPNRIAYRDASIAAENLLVYMRSCPNLEDIEVAGSFRRRRETIGDLDIVTASADATGVIQHFRAFPANIKTLGA